MYMRFKDGKLKTVTLSYDDGVKFDNKLVDIMNKYKLRGTFNVNSGGYIPEEDEVGERWGMKLSEAKKLYLSSGQELAVHSFTHPSLDFIDDSEIIYQIIEDRKAIERDYGVITRGMAYPNGTYNDRVINVLKSCGIVYSRTVNSTEGFDFPSDWLEWHPTCHHNNPKLMELAKQFVEQDRWGRPAMFYLWGHTFEFHYDDNWNVMEEFAEYISGRDDIWYATNIEIYDYVAAYNRLETSYDKKMIHNPSAIDVWVAFGKEVIKIPAGTTVTR